MKFFDRLMCYDPLPAPDRLMPRFAILYGVKIPPMLAYCGYINSNDKLPRGLNKKLGHLRPIIVQKIKTINMVRY